MPFPSNVMVSFVSWINTCIPIFLFNLSQALRLYNNEKLDVTVWYFIFAWKFSNLLMSSKILLLFSYWPLGLFLFTCYHNKLVSWNKRPMLSQLLKPILAFIDKCPLIFFFLFLVIKRNLIRDKREKVQLGGMEEVKIPWT